ncbi:M56 family metallopeptidase [Cohnella cellulosilytica]|uniref:M56 family metallopeptidase n=1 Tax=Cohnella cellulosilytica TaxID=986710 RepID=A0ABW2FGU3_9BACL
MEHAVHLFGQVLAGSAEAALLALLIAAALRLGRKALSPAWSYALWFLLLAKLLLPLLPGDIGSQLRWLPLADAVEVRWPAFEAVDAYAGGVSPPEGAEASERNAGLFAVEDDGDAAAEPNGIGRTTAGAAARTAALVWLSGIVLALLLPLCEQLRMARALRREPVFAVPPELEALFLKIRSDSGIRSRIGLRLTSLVSGPALYGVLSPVVLVPRDLAGRLNEAEWECVLRHELTHHKRRDIPVNLLAYALAAAHWFNPLAWYGLGRMRAAQENACDASVLKASDLRAAYAACMVKLLEIGAARQTALSGVGFFGSKKLIARRIVMIRDYKPAGRRASYIGAALFVLAGALMLPSAFAADKSKPETKPQPVQVVSSNGNSAAAEIELFLRIPEDAKIGSRYGYRIHPVTSAKTLNDGIDVVGKAGTDIFAAGAGKVVQAEYDTAKGLTVTIAHNEAWSTEYRHLDKLEVEAGDEVKAGDLIGRMGGTGQSTGSHLHFSVLKQGEYVDPLTVTVIGTKAQ